MTDQCAWYSYSRKCYLVLIFLKKFFLCVWGGLGTWEIETARELTTFSNLTNASTVSTFKSVRPFWKRSLQPPRICGAFLFDLLCLYTSGTVCESVWGSRHWVRVGAEERYFWLLDTRQFHCRLSSTANGWRCARAHTHTARPRPTPTTHTHYRHTHNHMRTHTHTEEEEVSNKQKIKHFLFCHCAESVEKQTLLHLSGCDWKTSQ